MSEGKLTVIEKHKDIFSEYQKRLERLQPALVNDADALLLAIKQESRAVVGQRISTDGQLFEGLDEVDVVDFFDKLTQWVTFDMCER